MGSLVFLDASSRDGQHSKEPRVPAEETAPWTSQPLGLLAGKRTQEKDVSSD